MESVLDLLKKADNITRKYHKSINVERAIFLSWYCERRDCKFCYMSTLNTSKKAKRTMASILAEVMICKNLNWQIEFLSGGYGVYSVNEIHEIAERMAQTYQNVWLNTGIMSREDMTVFGDEIAGITGSLETFDFDLHEIICPSKPFSDVLTMLKDAKDLGLQTAITIILGLGEKKEKLANLFSIIREYEIDRITFYALNPQKGTLYEKFPSPSSLYYAEIVARTRIAFPKLEIVTGIWIDKTPMIGPLLLAGSDGITKFPMKQLLSNYANFKEEITYAAQLQDRRFTGTFRINRKKLEDELKGYEKNIKKKVEEYL
jgi:biotin synthase-like enzyme